MSTTKSLILLSLFILSLHAQSEPNPDELVCAVALFPAVCPTEYSPVCASAPKECITTPCFQTETIHNGCEACKTEGVQSYIPGICQYTCDPQNLPPSGPLQDIVDPVCGSYTEDCQDSSCRATFSSSTLACEDPDVVQFSLGACDDGEGEWNEEEECIIEEDDNNWGNEEYSGDDDNIEYCTGERPEICTMIYAPVCVVRCVSGDCRRTAASDCTACSDPDVLGYIPGGECESQMIQCPVLDLSATDIMCTMEYAPVCGYDNGCTDPSCGTTAGNACEACSVQGKNSYTEGACEDASN